MHCSRITMSIAPDNEPGVIPESEPTLPPVVKDYSMRRLDMWRVISPRDCFFGLKMETRAMLGI